jgi:hypothetical protein
MTIATTNDTRFKIVTLTVLLLTNPVAPLEFVPSKMPGDEEHGKQDEKQDTLSFLSSTSHQILEALQIYLCGSRVSVHYCSEVRSK